MKTSIMKNLHQHKFMVICVLIAVGFALAVEPQKAAALLRTHKAALTDNKLIGKLYSTVNAGSVTGKNLKVTANVQNPVKSAGVGGSAPPAPNAGAAVLYDQTNNPTGNGAPDQDFEPSFDAYDSEGADDFVVPAGRIWTVESVVEVSTTGIPAAQLAKVTFYADNAGFPGAAVCTKTGQAANVTAGSTTITLSGGGCVLPAGTYWVGIQVSQNFASNGQHFWSNRSTQSGSGSVWRNPGGGFATGCTNFGRQTTCGVGGGVGPDFLFRLDGQDNSAITDSPVGPGTPFPVTSEASDQKMGSVLIYNAYTSGATSSNTQNTRINITNVNPSRDAFVHLFFVAESCSVADSYTCLTANQTSSFLASDLDPGTNGYLVAVAVDGVTGCPADFNFLIGDEYIKYATGHEANLGAEAISALAVPPCDGNSVTAQLNFDGVSYNRVSHALALDNIGSRADGNDTLLILNRIGGNLGTGAGVLGTVFGIFYDDAESSLSFTFNGGHQFRSSISNNFPRITPRFETYVPAGRTGWFKLWPTTPTLWGMTGAAINFNPNAASSAGAFNQGHNLHKLTLTNTANYVVPVFPPSC